MLWTFLGIATVLAGSGGPTAFGLSYTDSDEPDGPPFSILDLSNAFQLPVYGDELINVELPFPWLWHGEYFEEVTLSSNGVLFFEGATSSPTPLCPGADHSWSGIAAYWDDWGDVEVRYGEFGSYPHRIFAVEWSGPHQVVGGYGVVQLWLSEGGGRRPEAVIVLDDIEFGDPNVDFGASAAVGLQSTDMGSDLEWSCNGGLSSISVAWIGRDGYRVSAPVRNTDEIPDPWRGEYNFHYFGRSLGAGRFNADVWDDMVVGAQNNDIVYLFYGDDDIVPSFSSDANVSIEGDYGSLFGTAVASGDIDGDGIDELVVGAPEYDGAVSSSGSISIFTASELNSMVTHLDAAMTLEPPSDMGSARFGRVVELADINGDGYKDVVVGAHRAQWNQDVHGAALIWHTDAVWLASGSSNAPNATLFGDDVNDSAGRAITSMDLDGDGASEWAVSSIKSDGGEPDGGAVYMMPSGIYSGVDTLSTYSQARIFGDQINGNIGNAIKLGDVDGDGFGDLFIGAPFVDATFNQAGAMYAFWDAAGLFGDFMAGGADQTLYGESTSSRVGETLTVMDQNNDGKDDLIVAAPNFGGASSGGGRVGVFWELDGTQMSLSDADLQIIGSHTGGSLGKSITSADLNGDGTSTLLLAEPYADSLGWTVAGQVFGVDYGVDFIDEDFDGFVPIAAGGVDCNDDDATIFPSQYEDPSNLIDDDCDGWIDGVLMHRPSKSQWVFEAESQGMLSFDTFDFESGASGDDAGPLYSPLGLTLFGTNGVVLSTGVFGAYPRGDLSAKVYDNGYENELRLYFNGGADAVGMYLMDGDGTFHLTAEGPNGVIFDSIPIESRGENIPGGRYLGLVFTESVDLLRISGDVTDGFGVDDVSVVWTLGSDFDSDGYTEVDGDCDDSNPLVNPGVVEILNNNIDDDCDGAVDGGTLDVFYNSSDWVSNHLGDIEEIDFEQCVLGAPVASFYSDLGVVFSPTLYTELEIDGALPVGLQAGESLSSELIITFDEIQPAVGFWAIDVSGFLKITGYADGVELYSHSVDLAGENIDGGVFIGLGFDFGVDELLVENLTPFDDWGVDGLLFSPLGLEDNDGDGFTEADGDCDDSDGSVNPDATEVFYDGIDQDCAGDSDYDSDGDGHDSSAYGGTDCDDFEILINPGQEEIWYDGIDSNCDALSDFDADGDGSDSSAMTLSGDGGDCDDGNAAINPNAEEVYYDETDDNCDPSDDHDADGDGYPSSTGAGGGGFAGVIGVVIDCDDTDSSISPDATEVFYDGVDSDCDGGSDFDADGDGIDAEAYGGTDCDDNDDTTYPGSPYEYWYDGVDSDCDGASDFDQDLDGYEIVSAGGLDCDDLDASINPDGIEIPRDGIDSNCDGALEFDDDQDGYDGTEDGGTDCDDDNPDIYPGAIEIPYDDIDQNCDGESDYDADLDGFVSAVYGGDDCDDFDASIFPGAQETHYDGIDSNCDGDTDYDADGDGHIADWAAGDDCNDGDPLISPSAMEWHYDGVDQNCDGLSDFDMDEDGQDSIFYGGEDCDDTNPLIFWDSIEIPHDGIDQNCDGLDDIDGDGDGYFISEDCNDNDASIFPSAVDICYDGIDSDCAEDSDYDCDSDGFISVDYGGPDCNDVDPDISPVRVEIWYDGIDQNCDGMSDFDKDGDGYDSEAFGGTDCEDLFASIHPGVSVDDCGQGNEDCDDEIDEDCVGVSEPSGDASEPASEPSDAPIPNDEPSSEPDMDTNDTADESTVDSGISLEDVDRDEEDHLAEEEILQGRGTGPQFLPGKTDPNSCGCASSMIMTDSLSWMLLIGMLGFTRRYAAS